MNKRVLPRDYSAEEMDRGEGMEFHPDDGTVLGALSFSSEVGCFFCLGYWSADYLERISDGKSHRMGAPYPQHWRFDPFTGESLDEPVDDLDRVTGGEW